ncbi:hypothetical protein WG66_012373 [Moniliophthora roreri]|nr:hypothetical protein WG66_012373 [Moniliophthora roreri]
MMQGTVIGDLERVDLSNSWMSATSFLPGCSESIVHGGACGDIVNPFCDQDELTVQLVAKIMDRLHDA